MVKGYKLSLGSILYHCGIDEDAIKAFTPLALASLSGQIRSNRLLVWESTHMPWYQDEIEDLDDFDWNQLIFRGPGHNPSWVCDLEGHTGSADGSAESGRESFTCELCGWGFSCYH